MMFRLAGENLPPRVGMSTSLHRLDPRPLQPAGHDAGKRACVRVDVRPSLNQKLVDVAKLVALGPHNFHGTHDRISRKPASRGKCLRGFDEFV